jgi:hypothetical protein
MSGAAWFLKARVLIILSIPMVMMIAIVIVFRGPR